MIGEERDNTQIDSKGLQLKPYSLDIKSQFRTNIFRNDLGFMSETEREGQWLNSVDNPYTKQYNKLKPNISQLLYEKQKRIEKIRDKRVKTDKQASKSIPFNTQATREFDYTGDALGPGPGTYIDVNNPKYSSVLNKSIQYGTSHDSIMKKATNPSNFGSNIDRFENPDYK